MSTKLKLTADGLKRYRWNGEKKCEHNFKKKDGGWAVLKKDTKEQVFWAKTREEAEEIFWEEEEVGGFCALRDSIEVEPGATLGNFLDSIRNDEMLNHLIEEWFPYWNNGADFTVMDKPPENFLVTIQGLVIAENDDELLMSSICSVPPCDAYADLPFVLNEIAHIDAYEGKWCWDLLDVILAVFDAYRTTKGCYLNRDGTLTDWEGNDLDVFKSMLDICYLPADVKIADIVNFVDKQDEMFKMFLGMYAGCRVEAFQKESKKPPADDSWERNFNYVQLETNIEIDKWDGEKSIGYYRNVDAVAPISDSSRKMWEENGSIPPETENCGIDFSALNNLMACEYRVQRDCEIYEDARVENGEFVPGKTLRKIRYPHRLLDVIGELYWEISFCGSPDDRDEKFDGIQTSIEEYKQDNAADRPAGESFESVEEMFKKFEEEEGNDYDG